MRLLRALRDHRPGGLRTSYHRAARQALARPRSTTAAPVTEADLARLPAPVQRYLRRVGVLGRPRVQNFHAELTAEFRFGPDAPWTRARAEQWEFFHPAERLFFMTTSRGGVPLAGLHRYSGDRATMEIRAAGVVPVVRAAGREMTQSETVTLLNDMCVLAPAALVDAPIDWESLDERTVRATFTNACYRVSALVSFDDDGDLTDFHSDDRYMSADGNTMRRLPWNTPVRDYRDFGGVRLAAFDEARWTEASGPWAYGRFTLERIAYNVGEQ